jgi:hypothetical protein
VVIGGVAVGTGQCGNPSLDSRRPIRRQYVDRYRTMANELGFEGHIAMAEAMT